MNNITNFEPFDTLALFDRVLTGVDPALNIDAFNSFMTQPILRREIKPERKRDVQKVASSARSKS